MRERSSIRGLWLYGACGYIWARLDTAGVRICLSRRCAKVKVKGCWLRLWWWWRTGRDVLVGEEWSLCSEVRLAAGGGEG